MIQKLLVCAVLVFGFDAFAVNELTLHFIPTPKGLNWRSPQSLAASTLKNELAKSPAGGKHSIGHVYEEIRCGDFHQILGMTSEGNEEREAIFKEKVGLGVVLKKYKGRYNTTEEAIEDLTPMFAAGRSNFVTFSISDSTCKRIREYIVEYQRRGLDKIYAGLDAYPLRQEGSGCSAFGASFLEISGLLADEFKNNWMWHIIAPYKYIGGPTTGKKVSFFRILFAFKSKWATSEKYGVKLDFWDPELMHRWTTQAVNDIENQQQREFPWPAEIISRSESKGIHFDVRNVPTPLGDFFY